MKWRHKWEAHTIQCFRQTMLSQSHVQRENNLQLKGCRVEGKPGERARTKDRIETKSKSGSVDYNPRTNSEPAIEAWAYSLLSLSSMTVQFIYSGFSYLVRMWGVLEILQEVIEGAWHFRPWFTSGIYQTVTSVRGIEVMRDCDEQPLKCLGGYAFLMSHSRNESSGVMSIHGH